MAYRRGKSGNLQILFSCAPNHADGDCRHEIKNFAPWKESHGKPRCACSWFVSCGRLFVTPWTVAHSSVHGISQARILEWVVISFSRGSSRPRDWNFISCGYCIGRWILSPLGHLRSPSCQNLGSILKSREITLLTKVCIVEALVFPVVMYRCESLIIKLTEHQRFDVFKL